MHAVIGAQRARVVPTCVAPANVKHLDESTIATHHSWYLTVAGPGSVLYSACSGERLQKLGAPCYSQVSQWHNGQQYVRQSAQTPRNSVLLVPVLPVVLAKGRSATIACGYALTSVIDRTKYHVAFWFTPCYSLSGARSLDRSCTHDLI